MCKADAGQARRRILLAEAVRWARATAFADSRLTALGAGGGRHSPLESMGQSSMNMITTKDGVELYYKDWGPKDGPVVKIGRAHSELQSLMRISYAVFCLKKNTTDRYSTTR